MTASTRSSSTALRALALSLITLGLMFVVVPRAQATDFDVRTCAQAADPGAQDRTDAGWIPNGFAIFNPNGNCPAGLGFDTSKPIPLGSQTSWTFYLPTSPITNKLSLTLEGGDSSTGFRYSLIGCDGCDPFYDVPTRTASDPPLNLVFDGLDVTQLQVRATCTQDPCAPATSLTFHDVVLQLHDVTPPTAVISPISPEWSKAQNVHVDMSVTDGRGVGFGYASAYVDDASGRPFWTLGSCSMIWPGNYVLPFYSYTLPTTSCGDGGSYSGTPNLSGLTDGPHTISIRGQDGADNQMVTQSQSFNTDDTPPETPDDATVSGIDPGGWTALDHTSISFDNPAPDPALGEQSPLVAAWYQYQSISPAGPLSAPVEVDMPGQPTRFALNNLSIPSDGKWAFWVWSEDEAGNIGGKLKLLVNRDRDAPSAPVLAANPWVNRVALEDYDQQITSQNVDGIEAGICGYAVSVNASQVSDPPPTITQTGALSALQIPASTPAGDNWVHARAISCSGLASPTASAELRVDDVAPSVSLADLPIGAWSNSTAPLTLSADDPLSGVASMTYTINGVAKTVTGVASADVAVHDGINDLTYSATDVAGNTSPLETRTVQIDRTPPLASFNPRDPAHPTLVTATASDAASGVADAQIQYRRIDVPDSSWHLLPTAAVADPSNSKGELLSATIPDEQLAAGTYALQLHVTDAAHNTADSSQIGDTDASMRAVLPLRSQPQLSTGIVKVGKSCKTTAGKVCNASVCAAKHDSKCVIRPVVNAAGAKASMSTDFGVSTALVGELRSAAGTPIAGRQLKLFSAVDGKNPGLIGDVVTDAAGKFQSVVKAGPDQRLSVELDSTDTELPATAKADLYVASTAKLTVNRKVARVGNQIKFSGRLLGVVPGASPAKIPVTFEFLAGSNAQDFSSHTRTDAFGRFTGSYTFRNPVKKPTKLNVRAAILAGNSPWPFEDGFSNRVSVLIRP